MAELPACNDSSRDLSSKILLEFIELGTGVPDSLDPLCADSQRDIYQKILLTLAYI